MIADDIFAGAGGWDLAAAQLGIHARGVENMKEARATRDAAGLTTIHDDVWTFEPDGKAEGLIASPPCQTFSQAGKGAGRKALDDVLRLIRSNDIYRLDRLRDMVALKPTTEGHVVTGQASELDPRTALVLTPLHFALTNPAYRWLAWEQVPTVLPVWEACAERLRAHGWSAWTGYLFSEQYGVPQTRKRAFLLASRDHDVTPPTPTHSRYYSRSPEKLDEGVAKWVSMAEALGWGLRERPSPTVTGGGTETGGAEPIGHLSRYTDRPDWVMGTTNVRDGEYQSRSVDEPAPTITSAARSYRWGEPPLMVQTPGQKGGNMQENRVTVDDLPDFLRMTTMPNSAKRAIDEPAPTMAFGHDAASCQWQWSEEVAEQFTTEGTDDERGRPVGWPGPLIVGSFHPEIVAAPGYRTTTSRQNMPHSVRITVQEAGILQSFPADHPWQGGKGKQFLQAGNAIPPGMAQAALSAAIGAQDDVFDGKAAMFGLEHRPRNAMEGIA